MWSQDPHCKGCKKLTEYPHGFELDHIQALDNNGPDVEENTQVLCPECHEAKTALDLGYRQRKACDPDGWPTGKYQVEILLDGRSVATKPFEVQ